MPKSTTPRTMTRAEFATLLRRLKAHKEAIAKHRDAIRTIMQELDSYNESWTRAVDSLEEAVDALSEYL